MLARFFSFLFFSLLLQKSSVWKYLTINDGPFPRKHASWTRSSFSVQIFGLKTKIVCFCCRLNIVDDRISASSEEWTSEEILPEKLTEISSSTWRHPVTLNLSSSISGEAVCLGKTLWHSILLNFSSFVFAFERVMTCYSIKSYIQHDVADVVQLNIQSEDHSV